MAKRPREDEDGMTAEELRALLESGSEIPQLDVVGVKKLLLSLERAITANRAARLKHPSEPLKYLDSEVALDGSIKGLQALAAAPEHYAVLLSSGSLASLLDLFTHDNSDIAASVVSLLAELLGDEEEGEEARGLEASARRSLCDALHSAGGLELLAHTAARFQAPLLAPGGSSSSGSAVEADNAARDAEAFVGVLELIQSLLALRPSFALPLCAMQPPVLLTSLLARLTQAAAGFEEGKGAAVELLAVLAMPLLGDLTCPRAIGGVAVAGAPSGVDRLLEALSRSRKTPPRGADEKELVGNLLDTLCFCLVSAPPFASTQLRAFYSLTVPSTTTTLPCHHPRALSSHQKTGPTFLPVRAVSLCSASLEMRASHAMALLKFYLTQPSMASLREA